ncbi:AT-rich interactive domain-containing protein 3A [Menidia menidia]
MADNAAPASALQGSLSAARGPPSGSCPSPGRGAGLKLEAVMENLQRQQAARLALEDKLRQAEKEKDLRSMVESQIQQQALAFRHYQAAVRSALSAGVGGSFSRLPLPHPGGEEEEEEEEEEEDGGTEQVMAYQEDGGDVGLSCFQHRQPAARLSPESGAGVPAHGPALRAQSPSAQAQSHHEWTYEEQFKQLYELDDDEKRKEFLDDLFSFMQKRGTPVNRIPIMAKQVLDLYMLYKLVTEKGGLVEVINKKIWREITKGLNLPTSITSAAFTLRTQYMKYLYPYECEKRGLSSPGELQAAIDSNRREGRRQSYGSVIFNYSPVGTPALLSSPKMPPHFPVLAHHGGHVSQGPVVKTEDPLARCLPGRVAIHMSPGGPPAQTPALGQLREHLDGPEPPQKKMMLVAEEQQKLMETALQQNLIAMATQLPLSIKVNNRDDRQETALNLSTNGISSINMSIEINGVVYTGVLFAQQSTISMMTGHRGKHNSWKTQGGSSPAHFQPPCSSSSSSSS